MTQKTLSHADVSLGHQWGMRLILNPQRGCGVKLRKEQTLGYHLLTRNWSKKAKKDQDTTRWQHRAKYDSHVFLWDTQQHWIIGMANVSLECLLLCLIKDKIREIKISPQRNINIEAEEVASHCTEQTLN